MNAKTRIRRNGLHAATATTKALGYRTLSGLIATHVDAGRLIRTSDFLDRIGGNDLPDGQRSWFGRHVAKSYRAQHGGHPVRGRLAAVAKAAGLTREYVARIRDGKVKPS